MLLSPFLYYIIGTTSPMYVDVYKRQSMKSRLPAMAVKRFPPICCNIVLAIISFVFRVLSIGGADTAIPVSYTHLKSLMLALSQDLSQNRPAEAREHVRRFHEMFFTQMCIRDSPPTW